MENYILTYSKIKFNPLKAEEKHIKIEDIAHALSLLTRANGHIKHFYSIAQHAINCYREAQARDYSPRIQLGCLLHDASESYISDLTRPVKVQMERYNNIEEKLQQIIYKKYDLGDLTEGEKSKIKKIDNALLSYELKELMNYEVKEINEETVLKHDISQRNFQSVENEFIHIFNRLQKQKKGTSSS